MMHTICYLGGLICGVGGGIFLYKKWGSTGLLVGCGGLFLIAISFAFPLFIGLWHPALTSLFTFFVGVYFGFVAVGAIVSILG